ncbi:DUF4169 family protein [Sphingomonas sp.]|uniref:DUF4169 family protein n=1 Tax=Sphingomonas sp. TaxID=28214 RepID=UPI002BAD121F|nr:DUF4169 family protein [Sphingomonas sp.]HWK34974.1 DUF4169 family protein [Sphingomonas sp.]
MGEVVNLNRARKAKRRAEATAQADANRVAFGRTKAAKQAAAAEQDRAAKLLDGALRGDD